MSEEFEIGEEIDLYYENDDGNPSAQIRLGRFEEGTSARETVRLLTKLLERIPAEFSDKACIDCHYNGFDVVYLRPLTAEEMAQRAADDEEYNLNETERRRKLYEDLKAEFEPDSSGEANEPVSEAA